MIGRRTSVPLTQTTQHLTNYRSVASIPNQPIIETNTPVTIQSINQGNRSERSHHQVEHLNVQQIPEGGISTFRRNDVTPPVTLASFPPPLVQTSITQQTSH